MGPNLNDLDLAEQHRLDLLREADHLRAVGLAAQRPRPARRPAYAPALATLGRWLLALGTRLTAAYENP